MVLLNWDFMILSLRIEFSVMCPGPVMCIYPVRMGVHMLKSKLHEQTVSRGFGMSADIWLSWLVLDPLTFPNPSDPTSTSTEPELCAPSPPGENIIPAQSWGSPASRAGQAFTLSPSLPAIVSLQSVSQLHPPTTSQSWHWYLEKQFFTCVFWNVSTENMKLNEALFRFFLRFLFDMWMNFLWSHTSTVSNIRCLVWFLALTHFYTPSLSPPLQPPPKPGSSSAGIPSEGLAGTRVPAVANTNPTQPWTSHQVVLELQADAFWPCFSAVASFPGTLEAPGDANQVRPCLLWACLFTFWIALSYRRFLF